MGVSKLSAHAQVPSQGLSDFIAAAKPSCVKTMFVAPHLVDLSPNSVFIYRHYVGGNWMDRVRPDPQRAAEDLFRAVIAEPGIHRYDFVEAGNEWFGYGTSDSDLELADQYQAHFTRLCLADGLGVVLFNAGTGNLDANFMERLPRSVLSWIEGGGKVVAGWHQYVFPSYLDDKDSLSPEGMNGGWHGLRHRRILADMYNRGLITDEQRRTLPGVITEFGTTLLRAQDGRGDYGYQHLTAAETGGLSPSQYYWERTLKAFDQELSGDPTILGCTIFMTGSEDGGNPPFFDWRTFDVLRDDYIRPRFREHIRGWGAFPAKEVLKGMSVPVPAPLPELQPIEQQPLEIDQPVESTMIPFATFRADGTRVGLYNYLKNAVLACPEDGYVEYRPTGEKVYKYEVLPLPIVAASAPSTESVACDHGKFADDLLRIASEIIGITDFLR